LRLEYERTRVFGERPLATAAESMVSLQSERDQVANKNNFLAIYVPMPDDDYANCLCDQAGSQPE